MFGYQNLIRTQLPNDYPIAERARLTNTVLILLIVLKLHYDSWWSSSLRCISAAEHHTAELQNGQDKTPKTSRKKQYIVE